MYFEVLCWGVEIYYVLCVELKVVGYVIGFGDEGGFVFDLFSNCEGLDFLVKVIEKVGFMFGIDIVFGFDVVVIEFFKDGVYCFDNKDWDVVVLIEYYVGLVNDFLIVMIEDVFVEDDWDNWKYFIDVFGIKV